MNTDPPAPPSGAPSRGALTAVPVLLALAAFSWWHFAVPEADARLWRTYRITGVLVSLALTLVALATAYVVLGRGDLKKRVFGVVLAGMAGGLCLALVEVPALLGHNYQETFGAEVRDTWVQLSKGINRPDPELIHVHNAHDTFSAEVRGNLAFLGIPDQPLRSVSVRYDANGFRNATDLEQANVVAIGDSFIEAAIVSPKESVSGRLAENLGSPVANLGQAAYGFRQELAVLRRYGLPLEPKVVLWFIFGGNDFRDVELYERMQKEIGQPRPAKPLRDRAFIGNALLALSAATTPPRSGPTPLALGLSGVPATPAGGSPRVYFGDGCSEPSAYQWEVATGTLAEAGQLCAEANAHLLVIFITRKFRVYRHHVELEPGSLAAELPVNEVPERLAAWCAESDIAFLDLSPALEVEVAAGRHPYLFDDVHWNELGHEIAARGVAARLAELGWTPR